MQNFNAANDQYLQKLRDDSITATYQWLIDNNKQPTAEQVAIMRAAYAVAQHGDEVIRGVLVNDGWDGVFRGELELADWQDDWGYGSREDDEVFQLAVGFVIGAARAWVVARNSIRGHKCGEVTTACD